MSKRTSSRISRTRHRRAGSLSAVPTVANVSLKTSSENYQWPLPSDEDEKNVTHVKAALAKSAVVIPDAMILSYLACCHRTPRHASEAIKATVQWRKGRQLYLNSLRTQWPRYQFLQKCRSQGSGTASVFGMARDGRLVFYERLGMNFNLPFAQEFSESEFMDLIAIWCEQLQTAAIANLRGDIRREYQAFVPLLQVRKDIAKKKAEEKSKDGGMPIAVNGDAPDVDIDVDLIKELGISFGAEEALESAGECAHASVIGVIDWKYCDVDLLLANKPLMIAADRFINSHYPHLFYKLIHINAPRKLALLAKVWQEMKSEIHSQTFEKSVFVGVNKAEFDPLVEESTDTDLKDRTKGTKAHSRQTSDLRARRMQYGRRKGKKEEEKEKEEEKKRQEEEEAKRKAEEEEEKRLADLEANETAAQKRARLKALFDDIEGNMVPAEFGGSAQDALMPAEDMFRNLVGVSAEEIDYRYAMFGKETEEGDKDTSDDKKKKRPKRKRKPLRMRGQESDDDEGSQDKKDDEEKKGEEEEEKKKKEEEGAPSVKVTRKSVPLRARERHTLRLKAQRGELFSWQFTFEEPNKLITFGLVFTAEGGTGRSRNQKSTIRSEEDHKCGFFPLHGEYVTLSRGTLEFTFRNHASQRRELLIFTITQQRADPETVDRFLPPPTGDDTAPVSGRKGRYMRPSRLRRTGSLTRKPSINKAKTTVDLYGGNLSEDDAGRGMSQPPPGAEEAMNGEDDASDASSDAEKPVLKKARSSDDFVDETQHGDDIYVDAGDESRPSRRLSRTMDDSPLTSGHLSLSRPSSITRSKSGGKAKDPRANSKSRKSSKKRRHRDS